MITTHSDIDAGLAYQCKELEERGVPLDLSELNLRIFRKSQELVRMKEVLNQKFGFMPKFSDEKTWKRIFHSVAGHDITVVTGSSKVSMSRRTVEDAKHRCPALVDVYQGLRLEKLISQMTKAKGLKVESDGKHILKPRYKIDSISGHVFLRDPNLRTWGSDLKGTIREPGQTFILVWYDALDLMVLQDLAQDPILELDLASEDPYHTMACRFWETGTPTQEQNFIARMAFVLFCNGIKPDKFWASINTTYSDQCSLTSADAGSLYGKFIQHYTVCCEYFDKISRMAIKPRSAFGRWGIGRDSRCYAMTATVADITKLGFLSVLEDTRLTRLRVTPLTMVSGKMLLSVPSDQDFHQVSHYLLGDLRGAYPKYDLKPRISSGSSWGECEANTGPSQEEES